MKKSEHSDIENIILDHLVGDISEANIKKLEAWRKQSTKNERSHTQLEKAWNTQLSDAKYINYNSLEEKIIKEGFEHRIGKKRLQQSKFSFYKIAASITLLLATTFILYLINLNGSRENEKSVAAVEIITKHNPRGQKSRIILSDNSVVWLNADSKLTYKKGFTDSIRYLVLEGEAYFVVTKDVNRPFVVQSGTIKTIALGTSFNIRDYTDETFINVALIEGKVRVETDLSNDNDYFLDPNEQLEFSKQAEFISKGSFNRDQVSIWKDGIVHFQKKSFEYVVHTLERSYDVTINTSNYNNKTWSYTGEFDNMSLELILKRIGYSEGFTFEINKKQVVINSITK